MRNKIIDAGIIILLISISFSPGFSQTTPAGKDYPPVTLDRTEIRTLHSKLVGQDYELWISLPRSYAARDTVFPVIIILDPYRGFSIIKGFTDVLTTPYTFIPEVILVGIGYGGTGTEAMLNWVLGRTRDLTPVKNTRTEDLFEKRLAGMGIPNLEFQTGGAPLFLEFIKNELFPFLETSYRVDKHARMLSGYSFGGLFGMYVLFHEPQLFQKYFIGSPSLHYSDGITFDYEAKYAADHPDLPADVFMSAGALETGTPENLRKMEELLRSRNYKDLILETNIFEKENHVTCMPAAVSRGFVKLFNNEEK